jgi:hypothetical protein
MKPGWGDVLGVPSVVVVRVVKGLGRRHPGPAGLWQPDASQLGRYLRPSEGRRHAPGLGRAGWGDVLGVPSVVVVRVVKGLGRRRLRRHRRARQRLGARQPQPDGAQDLGHARGAGRARPAADPAGHLCRRCPRRAISRRCPCSQRAWSSPAASAPAGAATPCHRTVRKIWGTREALAALDLPPILPVTFADAADLGLDEAWLGRCPRRAISRRCPCSQRAWSSPAASAPAEFIQDPLDYGSRTHHSSADTFDHLKADDMRQASVGVGERRRHRMPSPEAGAVG